MIIPLLKADDCDPTVCDNYRAIMISPCVSKVFELCLSSILHRWLGSDELQLGFKKDGRNEVFTFNDGIFFLFARSGKFRCSTCLAGRPSDVLLLLLLLLFYFFTLGINVPKGGLKKLEKVKKLGMSKIPCGHKRAYCHVEEQR